MNSKTSDQSPEGRTRGGSAVTLGEQLRLAREARGLSLRQISEQTRISTRYLEAIETNDYKQLPGGIFNRSFVKAYAKHVGMSEPDALDLYSHTAREHGEPTDEALTTPRKSLVYTDGSSGDGARSAIVTWLLSGLLLVVLCLVVLGGLNLYQRRNERAVPANNTATPTTNTQATPQTAPSTLATTAGLSVQIRARGDRVAYSAQSDEGEVRRGELRVGDEGVTFPVERQLVLRYSKFRANNLEVITNGTQARTVSEGRGASAEMVITTDNFRQYLP